jgi:hypothetical protein
MDKNDQKMLDMMIEMTRTLCGEEKAKQIAQCTEGLKASQDPNWGTEIVTDEKFYIAFAESIEKLGVNTLEEVLALFSNIHLKDLFGGLIYYTGTKSLTYKGRSDWALHFIYGAWIELCFKLGEEAGYIKEWADKNLGTGQFEESDIQATKDGAEWIKNAKV